APMPGTRPPVPRYRMRSAASVSFRSRCPRYVPATAAEYVCIALPAVPLLQSSDIADHRERGPAPRLLGACAPNAGLRGIMMISISSRSRLVAASSPFAVAVLLASTPASAEGAAAQPPITGAASPATAAQAAPRQTPTYN